MAEVRICLVVASLKAGGMERVMVELGNWFVTKNIDITLILLHRYPKFFAIDERIRIIEPDFKAQGFSRILYPFKIIYYIRRNILSIKPNSVLTFGRVHNPYVALSLMGSKIPVYVSDRGSPYFKGKFLNEFLRKIMYKKVSGIISQTEFSKEFILKTIRNKNVEVIPNPLRKIEFQQKEKENKIIYAGRLIQNKGVQYLIEAFSRLDKKDWKLIIIGDGPMRIQLEQKARELAISDNILFTGEVKNIDSYFSGGEIFAFPSLMEGFPNVLVEAMAHGLACVSFNCITGPSELIEDGQNGFLVEVGAVDELSSKLSLLMTDEKLRHTFQDRAKEIRGRYDISKIGLKYLKFITNNRYA